MVQPKIKWVNDRKRTADLGWVITEKNRQNLRPCLCQKAGCKNTKDETEDMNITQRGFHVM